MTTTISQTVFSPWLTPVRLVSTSNIAGTYSNGPSNNGVGATLTIAATSLTIDAVLCVVGDRVLLQTQTNTYEQGVYVVKSIDTTVVLERSDDQQSIEQLKKGEYVSVGAGSGEAGNFYTLVEPLPNFIGVDAINYMSSPNASGAVNFSGPASTANALVVFSDTTGDIKAASAACTLGQALAITGTLSATGHVTFEGVTSTGATGTGNLVFSASPTLVTPLLGTPTSGTLTNCTGLPIATGVSGLGAGVATFLATPTSANLAAAVTNETGSGALVFATSPTMVTPILGAASATSITFSSTSGIIGSTTNDNAAAGSVGETISSVIASGSAVSLTTATVANVTSISLTAGDWDVWGNVSFIPAATTNVVAARGWSSTTSVTLPDSSLYNGVQNAAAGIVPASDFGFTVPSVRVSTVGTVTVYLSAVAVFSVDTLVACGGIYARRRR